MSLAAGDLCRAIRIDQRDPDALDALNMPVQGDAAWEPYKTTWGNPKGQSGMGVIRTAAEVNASVNAYSWRIRYDRTINRGMRLIELATGDVYDIMDVRHDLDRREWTDLICHVGGTNG